MRQLIPVLLAASLLFGCSEPDISKIIIDPGFSSYVSAFTSGVVSNRSTIKVVLIEPSEKANPGSIISADLFEFEPELEGQAYWLDEQTIEFRPNAKLPSGKTFVGTFHLDELMEVPDDFEVMQFGFIVMHQSLFVAFEGLNTLDPNDFSQQELFGTVRTSDDADHSEVERCLKASQDDQELELVWEHTEGSKEHRYTVKGVTRGEKESYVELEWDGEPIGADVDDDLEVRIPPLDEFTMVQVNTVRLPGLHFSVQFSDPLDRGQDLTGLIHLQSDKNLRFSIEGNEIKAYPTDQLGSEEIIIIEEGIMNVKGATLEESYMRKVQFNLEKPALELLGDGVIMPSSGAISFPFKAVNLKAVDLRIVRVFEQNVPQFLQVNQLSGYSELTRVGRIVYDQEVDLISSEPIDYGVWNNFSIDLSSMIQREPGAIYRVMISFHRYHSLYPCSDSDGEPIPVRKSEPNFDDGDGWYSDRVSYIYEEDWDYDWDQRDNPCHPMFYQYGDHGISANVFASDLGMIAKESADDIYDVVITDIRTTEPLSGVDVEAYNYQNAKIGEGSTNGDGVVRFKSDGKPYLVVAKQGTQRGYLRVDNGSALSVSLYEVGGNKIEKGVKGFLYGERGVWRPGDSIFLSFMLEDKQDALPPSHPVVLEFYDPMGKLYDKKVSTKGVDGLYAFKLQTGADDMTGLWNAKVTVGNSEFRKSLKIETVKPNRLKINLDFGDVVLSDQSLASTLNAQWLYGAPGADLVARTEMEVANMKTQFEGYEDYQFDDRSKRFYFDDPIVSESRTNADGDARLYFDWDWPDDAPGMLKMKFRTKVFEQGGDFSQDFMSTKYSPYETYVGLKMPAGSNWITALNSEDDHAVAIAAVDEEGNPIDRSVNLELYEMRWNWWWEGEGGDELTRYVSRQSEDLVASESVRISDGKGVFNLTFPRPDWGKYMLRIVDPVSGHSAASVFYVMYPGWYNNDDGGGTDAASMLSIETGKAKYEVDEQIEVTVPSGGIGNIYVTVEKGDQILDQFWVEAASGSTTFNFEATEEMAPNVYVSATLLQPHGQDENSLPLRMYGVTPIYVNDPNTHLTPVIVSPDELQPEKTFEVEVSEKDGKDMAYTLAVVDEGLLSLTRFKTPNPWYTFYTKEALRIRTWDMYKYVMNAETGKMASLLAVGGDEGLVYKEDSKANRFKPVVKFLGPFYLDGGDENTHEIKLPNYIGAVRIMVVAGHEGAYGSAEKEVQVKQPLMVLSTLPRVLGPSERIKVPVNVITMDDRIKNVSVKVTANDLLQPLSSLQQQVSFSKQGEKTVYFEFDVARKLGVAEFRVDVSSGNETAFEEVELDVRPPNPAITRSESKVVEAGQSWSLDYEAFGITGTNAAVLQVSRIPDLNLEKHLDYLIRYPHGCIEQTTSSVFPQLFVNSLIELDGDQKDEIEQNIIAGLNRLRKFQTSSGGFTYWPGHSDHVSDWGTNYAGHFLLEAKERGYDLPVGMLDQWIKFQTEEAGAWSRTRHVGGRYGGDLQQAYRLYTLALSGNASVGAMNRLRSDDRLSDVGAWRLAAAYALIGREDVARELSNRPMTVPAYRELSYTFGSNVRDMAMILESLVYLRDYDRGGGLLQDIATDLSKGWHSTQTRAYAMLAISKFIGGGEAKKDIEFTVEVNGETDDYDSDVPISSFKIDPDHLKSGRVSVTNSSDQVIFASLVQTGMPVEVNEEPVRDDLMMSVVYKDMEDRNLDISRLRQGTDFKAVVTIKHPGIRDPYKEVALNQIFPSGWQIVNTRVGEEADEEGSTNFTYQDIRDDRVYTYFDIHKGRTKTYEILLNATFAGRFYKPAVYCAPMYDESIQALDLGGWIEVRTEDDDDVGMAE